VYTWEVKEAQLLNGRGLMYRYVCSCGHGGQWFRNPNDADGDSHLYRVHGIGDG